MNIQNQTIISISAILALMSLSAQSASAQAAESTSASPAISIFLGQPVSSVAQKNTPVENQAAWKESASRDFSFKGMKDMSARSRKSRVKNLSIGIAQTEMFTDNDRASLTLYALTPTVNRSLSFVKGISDSRSDGAWVAVIQALSLAVTRQINTELAYSITVSKNSKFDSTISYHTGPITDSEKPRMIASFRYNGTF